MRLTELYRELLQNQSVLMLAGLGLFILSIVLIIAAIFDSQQILGISRWIKPIKFTVSGAIFLWTVAVYLYYLPGRFKTARRIIAWGVAGIMIGEIGLIIMQSARGVTSHFNLSTPLDAAVFGVMGLMISFSTFLIIYLTYLYFRAEINLPKALIWGMRLGLIVFLVGSIQGGYMSAHNSHTVGAADGGAGLPVVNWSSESGDLRVAHFVGLHALQAIPLFAFVVVFLQKRFSPLRPTLFTIVFAALYVASFTMVFVQAARGKPLLGKEMIVAGKPAAAVVEKSR